MTACLDCGGSECICTYKAKLAAVTAEAGKLRTQIDFLKRLLARRTAERDEQQIRADVWHAYAESESGIVHEEARRQMAALRSELTEARADGSFLYRENQRLHKKLEEMSQ